MAWTAMREAWRFRLGAKGSGWGNWGIGFHRNVWPTHNQYSVRVGWWALILDVRRGSQRSERRPYGFDASDVQNLRALAGDGPFATPDSDTDAICRSLASRIAALLPPEEK